MEDSLQVLFSYRMAYIGLSVINYVYYIMSVIKPPLKSSDHSGRPVAVCMLGILRTLGSSSSKSKPQMYHPSLNLRRDTGLCSEVGEFLD